MADEFFRESWKYVVALGVAVGSLAYLLLRRQGKVRRCGVDYPRNTVIVHQTKKGKHVPSLGHFVMKLETYLRIAKIPYEPHYSFWSSSPKGKVPWMEYNGVTMGDSQLIMNYLNKELKVDLNSHLSPYERAVAWGIQKWLEEFTYWLNVYTRWYLYSKDMFAKQTNLPKLFQILFRRKVKRLAHSVGIGRHTKEEVGEMIQNDLRQLSNLLGDKKYLMGDRPTELDCTAFGQLAQIRWATPDACPGKSLLTGKLKNLMDYLDRMKTEFWPDWDERIACPDVTS